MRGRSAALPENGVSACRAEIAAARRPCRRKSFAAKSRGSATAGAEMERTSARAARVSKANCGIEDLHHAADLNAGRIQNEAGAPERPGQILRKD